MLMVVIGLLGSTVIPLLSGIPLRRIIRTICIICITIIITMIIINTTTTMVIFIPFFWITIVAIMPLAARLATGVIIDATISDR